MAISTEKLVKLSQLQMEATRVKQELDKKQDTLVFNTAYDATNNKAATMRDVTDAVAGLSGAMHFKGTSTQDPTKETTPGTQDGPAGIEGYTTPAAGDVVTFGKKEFLYDGSKWREYGDEGDYAVKGAIKNADIADDAAISKAKIAGDGEGKTLEDDLAAKASKVAGEGAKTGEILTADANGDMQASGKKVGDATLKASPDSNTVATEAAVKAAIEGQSTAVASTSGVGGSKGLMSAADKEKLDTIQAGANKVEPSETLGNVKINDVETPIFAVAADSDITTMLNTVFGAPAASD